MANILGSRYTSPQGAGGVWEATADLAQTGFDVGLGIMEAVDSAESQSQLRSLDVGMIERYDNFAAWMDDNGSNPDAFLTEFDTRSKQWKTELMTGVTQRRAQRTAKGNIDTNIARWRGNVRQKQYTQKAHNVGVDAKINTDKFLAAPDRTWEDTDVTERLKAFGLLTEQMWDGQQFDTETQRNTFVESGRKQILSHYALQQAQSPEYFDSINQVFRETGWLGAEVYDEKEIAGLKKQYLAEKDFNEKLTLASDEKAIEKATTDALKLAADGDLQGAKKLAVDMLGKYPHEKFIDTLNNIQNAASILHKTGQNPYTTTQDWNAAMEAYWKAEKGIVPDRNDVGSKYDVQWYEKIKKITTDGPTGKDFEDSSAAKLLVDAIDADDDFPTPVIELAAKRKGLAWLQQEMDKTDPPLKNREKEELALKIVGDLKKDRKSLALTPEGIRTPQEKAELEVRKAAAEQELIAKQRDYQPTQAEFRRRIAQLKAQGQERAARKYYDQWKAILWPQ